MTMLDEKQKTQSEPVAFFVSDLHLQQSHPKTTQAFFDFLSRHACKATQLYVLGDLFEYWVGDDDLVEPFNKQVIDAIRRVSDGGTDVFWIAGNRDFLVGDDFFAATGMARLPDPFVATIADQQIVLTHGDAQCTDDLAYMAFRDMVRQANWQENFLAMPLAQRKAIVSGMRNDSRQAQQSKSYEIMDVNAESIQALFGETQTSVMIHGHTHRPGRHFYRIEGLDASVRFVLPDWECDVEPMRGGWIEIGVDAAIRRFGLDGNLIAW